MLARRCFLSNRASQRGSSARAGGLSDGVGPCETQKLAICLFNRRLDTYQYPREGTYSPQAVVVPRAVDVGPQSRAPSHIRRPSPAA